jgi:type II secretory pathway predicted ATPase ExeA
MFIENKLPTFGLRTNPFFGELSAKDIYVTDKMEIFCQKAGSVVTNGGFAVLTGDPGMGKSCLTRRFSSNLAEVPELMVRALSLPKCSNRDFYRQMTKSFAVPMATTNRYSNFSSLREKWQSHVRGNNLRPILIIDEAQELSGDILLELRLLGSTEYDSKCILGVFLAGDRRLQERLQQAELSPIASRVRATMNLDSQSVVDMGKILDNSLDKAGNIDLFSPGLKKLVVDSAAGNPRTMMTIGNDLLMNACAQGASKIDEDMFYEIFASNNRKKR